MADEFTTGDVRRKARSSWFTTVYSAALSSPLQILGGKELWTLEMICCDDVIWVQRCW
jgi:hypothetical protein